VTEHKTPTARSRTGPRKGCAGRICTGWTRQLAAIGVLGVSWKSGCLDPGGLASLVGLVGIGPRLARSHLHGFATSRVTQLLETPLPGQFRAERRSRHLAEWYRIWYHSCLAGEDPRTRGPLAQGRVQASSLEGVPPQVGSSDRQVRGHERARGHRCQEVPGRTSRRSDHGRPRGAQALTTIRW
jgi:hypothetical protein